MGGSRQQRQGRERRVIRRVLIQPCLIRIHAGDRITDVARKSFLQRASINRQRSDVPVRSSLAWPVRFRDQRLGKTQLGGFLQPLLAALHRPHFPRQADLAEHHQLLWQRLCFSEETIAAGPVPAM